MIQRRAWAAVLAGTVIVLSGCTAYPTYVKETEGIELPKATTFRMSHTVVDPDGNDITDEIFENDTERWYMFQEYCHEVRRAFQARGFKFIFGPGRPADFLVQVGFSAFYSEMLDEERMLEEPFATLMVGRRLENGMYQHMVVIDVLAQDPHLSSDDHIVYWSGRGTHINTYDDPRSCGRAVISELVARFPEPWKE